MKKEILSRVTIDMELLSDMETLNIVGGFSYDPNTTNAEKCVTNGDECTFNETKCIVKGYAQTRQQNHMLLKGQGQRQNNE